MESSWRTTTNYAPQLKTFLKVGLNRPGSRILLTPLKETRSVTEPAGALSLAGLKRYIHENDLVGAGKRFVAVISGANMNFGRLRFVAERAELGEGREALLSVEIPEKPGRCVQMT